MNKFESGESFHSTRLWMPDLVLRHLRLFLALATSLSAAAMALAVMPLAENLHALRPALSLLAFATGFSLFASPFYWTALRDSPDMPEDEDERRLNYAAFRRAYLIVAALAMAGVTAPLLFPGLMAALVAPGTPLFLPLAIFLAALPAACREFIRPTPHDLDPQ